MSERRIGSPPGNISSSATIATTAAIAATGALFPGDNVVGLPFFIYFSLHQLSATEANTLPDDRLGHEKSPLDTVMDFARWSRMFKVIH